MDLKYIKETGTKVYLRALNGRCYECLDDKSRKEVDKDWLYEKCSKNILYNFKAIIIDEAQVNFLQRCLENDAFKKTTNPTTIEFYRYFGLLPEASQK